MIIKPFLLYLKLPTNNNAYLFMRKSKLLIIYFLVILSAFFYCISCKTIAISKVSMILGGKSIIWDTGEENMSGYRIPGIVVSARGTVLAFAEARPEFGDADPKSIVLKRSEDGGKTWLGNIYIEKCDGSFWSQNRDKIDLNDVTKKKEVWTNIAPLVDSETGRIFFFYSLSEGKIGKQNLQRYTRVFYKYSNDDGLTWSERVEITAVLNSKKDGSPNKDQNGNWITDVNGFPCDYLGRAFHMPGPGHGLQLSGGRLLFQVWNRTALGVNGKGSIPVSNRKYGICTIFSDDHGETWKYGSAFGHEGQNLNESRMVELENGDIYLNARYVNNSSDEKNNYRCTAISHDKGINWADIQIDKNFPLSNPCDAGLVRIKDTRENQNLILYSKNESNEGRKNLIVRLSYDEGKSWPVSKRIDEGPAWYSDLAVLPDKTILLVYETGLKGPVYCVRFNLEWFKNK